jgi:hypothetical protein
MDDIAACLNTSLPAPVQVPVLAATAVPDQCIRCGARAGHDASCRCLGCGFIDFDFAVSADDEQRRVAVSLSGRRVAGIDSRRLRARFARPPR